MTEGCKTTDPQELRRQIMDSNVPKNEREWWAREIERLLAEKEAYRTMWEDNAMATHKACCRAIVLDEELAAERAEKERLREALGLAQEVLNGMVRAGFATSDARSPGYFVGRGIFDKITTALSAPAPAEAKVATGELLAALEPLAKVPFEDFRVDAGKNLDTTILMGWNDHCITIGDVRRARAAVAKAGQP